MIDRSWCRDDIYFLLAVQIGATVSLLSTIPVQRHMFQNPHYSVGPVQGYDYDNGLKKPNQGDFLIPSNSILLVVSTQFE